jgi:hypothetical protein
MHTGSIDGMCAIIGLVPEKRLGVYVLENLDHAELRHGLMYSVFDLYSGGPSRDWSRELHELFASLARSQRPAVAGGPRAESHPSLPLEKYVGTYVDSTYGTIEVTLSNGALEAKIADATQRLEPVAYEAFRSQGPAAGRQGMSLTFVPDGDGNVTAVRLFGLPFARVRSSGRR